MWRLNACPRLIEPLARISKRFDALFFVFIFGILAVPFFDGVGRSCETLSLLPLVEPRRGCCCTTLLDQQGLNYFFFFGDRIITI
jgi:hypothetical protein